MNENELYRELLETERRVRLSATDNLRPVTDYAGLVYKATWRQAWNPESRTLGPLHDETRSIWSDAIERCLKENGSAFIPRMPVPVYIDRPIVLQSGNRLIVHPETEIRLKPGRVGTCMVRNAHIVFAPDRPVEMADGADPDILIEGGIWSDQNNEGRGRGGAGDESGSMPGSNGVFLLHNVSSVAIRNVRFRDCSPYAIQLGNATDFLIERIAIDESADGIHIEGPSARGIIRHVAGKTNDDIVALNAWDWDTSSLTFGPIADVLVEDIVTRPAYTWSELRLLPGTKVFPTGKTLDCDIRRCVFRNVRGIHTFKIYDQPNVSRPEQDFANPIGKMSDLFFADLEVDGIRKSDYYDKSSDGVFDVCADIDGLSIRNVRFTYTPGENEMAPYLVLVGPKALTWPKSKFSMADEEGWKEVFNPNANPVVSRLKVKDVYRPVPGRPGAYELCKDLAALVHARCLTLNPDFPRTLPRGGTGHGRVIDPVFG